MFAFFLEFKYGKAPILIATDVASRGLGQYPPLFLFTLNIFEKESVFAFFNSSASF